MGLGVGGGLLGGGCAGGGIVRRQHLFVQEQEGESHRAKKLCGGEAGTIILKRIRPELGLLTTRGGALPPSLKGCGRVR